VVEGEERERGKRTKEGRLYTEFRRTSEKDRLKWVKKSSQNNGHVQYLAVKSTGLAYIFLIFGIHLLSVSRNFAFRSRFDHVTAFRTSRKR
jgi:hypothetical protein